MSILILAEHDNQQLSAETAKVVFAAQQLGGEIEVLVVGHQCQSVADDAAKLASVAKVLLVDDAAFEHQQADNVSKLVNTLAAKYDYILAAATSTGKDTLPRVAALLDVNQISDITAVVSEDTFVRPIYAGNALATVKSLDPKKVITVRSSAFDAVAQDGAAPVEKLDLNLVSLVEFISQTLTESVRPELTTARIVVSGGRGVGSAENFTILEQLADKLGAALGASRAAVDAGFVPNDLQVGQTGKIVAPDLYIAVGISGAIQHLAGMKDAKVIVAINKDPEAPIFQIADYGLEADLFDVIPKLLKLI